MGSRHEAAILDVITRGPTNNRRVSTQTGIKITTTNSILGRLLGRKEIVCIGFASEAGMTDVYPHAHVYALPGTPRLCAHAAHTDDQSIAVAQPIKIGRGCMRHW